MPDYRSQKLLKLGEIFFWTAKVDLCPKLLLFFRRLHGLRRSHVLARRAGGRGRGRRIATVHHCGVGDQRKENQVGNRYL